MKQIDRLVIREIIGPWLFGVALFTALLFAGLYLNRVADYVVKGVPPNQIVQLTLLLLPAIVAKTFGMAILLAGLLAFGRLSSDSEVVALRAAGASITRIILPVIVFSIGIAALTLVVNEQIVPPAANRAKVLLIELAEKGGGVTGEPIHVLINEKDTNAVLVARSFNLAARTMSDVSVTTYTKDRKPTSILLAKEMEFRGVGDWHIRGESQLILVDNAYVIRTNEAWPPQVPKVSLSPADIMTASNNDNDVYSMAEIKRQIDRGKRDGNLEKSRIANLEYGFWNKISVPLAAIIFGTLGAVLGIRNARTGTATGFAMAVGIIFGYMLIANFMNVWALGGVLPAWIAAFLPLVIGFVCAVIIMWRRNA
ncbi:MAG: LptF/LptG family permease [Fimbriimonas sp.]